MLTVQSHSPGMPPASKRDLLKGFNDRARAAGWAFTCTPAGDFEHAELTAAHALWCEKAQDRPMPRRADLTARATKAFITHMSLLERIEIEGRQRYRIRLHGSTLARYITDSTGKFLEEAVEPERLESYINLYDTVLELRAPVRVVSYYQAPEIDYLMGESLVAPLSLPDRETPILLSVTYAKPRSEYVRPVSLSASGLA